MYLTLFFSVFLVNHSLFRVINSKKKRLDINNVIIYARNVTLLLNNQTMNLKWHSVQFPAYRAQAAVFYEDYFTFLDFCRVYKFARIFFWNALFVFQRIVNVLNETCALTFRLMRSMSSSTDVGLGGRLFLLFFMLRLGFSSSTFNTST